MKGLWYAHFTAGTAQGDGMAVLRDGEILGGDPTHTYTGTYNVDGERLYASVCISPYAHATIPPTPERRVTAFLQGTVLGETASVSGHPDGHADLKIAVELHRAA